MLFVRIAGLFGAAVSIICAQTAPPVFEVASIKLAAPPTDGRIMTRMSSDAGRINFSNVSLMNLITTAYRVKEHQISGPDWLRSTRFDVTAKIPEGVKRDQVPDMLKALLADRFNLKVHTEPKVMPAYALLPAKGGPKLTKAEKEGGLRMMMGPKGRHMSGSCTMDRLADTLSNALDRPVLNQTELEGPYQVDLEWSDDGPSAMRGMHGGGGPGPGGPGPGGPPGPGGSAGGAEPQRRDEGADAPTIFTALQEKMGLRLDPRKAPVDMFIVDNIERLPTEN